MLINAEEIFYLTKCDSR